MGLQLVREACLAAQERAGSPETDVQHAFRLGNCNAEDASSAHPPEKRPKNCWLDGCGVQMSSICP